MKFRLYLWIFYFFICSTLSAQGKFVSYFDYAPIIQSSHGEAWFIFCTHDSSENLCFYMMEWPTQNTSRVLQIPPQQEKNLRKIYFRKNGNIIALFSYDKYEELVMKNKDTEIWIPAPIREIREADSWSSEEGLKLEVKKEYSFPPFQVSPSGERILFYDTDVQIYDKMEGRFLREFIVSQLLFGKTQIQTLYRGVLDTCWLIADQDHYRYFLGWPELQEEFVFFNDFLPGQLTNQSKYLWAFDLNTKTFRLLSSKVEDAHSVSRTGTKVLFSNNDETCCSGINYTDNQLFEYDILTHQITKIYSEYETFGNKDQPSEYIPMNARFSPNEIRIAYEIEKLWVLNGKDIDKERVDDTIDEPIDNTKDEEYEKSYEVRIYDKIQRKTKRFSDAMHFGWLTDDILLIRPVEVEWDETRKDWKIIYKDTFMALNVNSMSIEYRFNNMDAVYTIFYK